MRNSFRLMTLVFLVAAMLAGCAGKQGKNSVLPEGRLTEEQLSLIAEMIRETEESPLSKNALELRPALMQWLIQSPDISVTVFDLLKLDKNYKYTSLFILQSALSSARIIIENPDLEKMDEALQLLTLQKMLDVYDIIVAQEGESAKCPAIEKVIKLQNEGGLEQYIKEITNVKKDDFKSLK